MNNDRLKNIFFPARSANEFNLARYVQAIEAGDFRDVFNLGVCESGGGSWLLKDFTQDPNALFVGSMGSGKSFAASFTLSTWLMSNSARTVVFICDSLKDANDYSEMFDYPQVYPITGRGGKDAAVLIDRVIDLVFSEAMARKDVFSEVQAISVKDYEDKTGKPMARVVVLLEEFHAIPNQLWDFERNFKKPHTIAAKWHQLMRIGRSYGIFFIACSQKSTSSDIPTAAVPNFTQKAIFKVSKGEAAYVLGHDGPANLTSSQKGRCYTDYGAVQYPLLDKRSQKILLKRFMVPLEAECAYLNPDLIRDYLEGKSTRDLFRLKKLTELADSLESIDGELVIQLIQENLGNEVERLDSKTDNFGLSMIVTTERGDRRAIMYRKEAKVGHKILTNLSNAIHHHKCSSATLYCLGENIIRGTYVAAADMGIKIQDLEDIKLICRQLDAGHLDKARDLDVVLSNTDEIPSYVSEDDIRHARDRHADELVSDAPTSYELARIDHNELNHALMGEDPAIARALKATKRRKEIDEHKKTKAKKNTDLSES